MANEGAVFVLTTSADPTAVDFSVAGAGDVAGILRESGLSTTHLTHFNGGATVDAEVGDKTCPLLWQAVDSAEMRSLERRLAEGFHPEGMVQEEEGRDVLAKFLLLSPRLVAVGWVQIKLAAAAVDDEETAVRLGRARTEKPRGMTSSEDVRRVRVWCLLAPSRGGAPLLGETWSAD